MICSVRVLHRVAKARLSDPDFPVGEARLRASCARARCAAGIGEGAVASRNGSPAGTRARTWRFRSGRCPAPRCTPSPERIGHVFACRDRTARCLRPGSRARKRRRRGVEHGDAQPGSAFSVTPQASNSRVDEMAVAGQLVRERAHVARPARCSGRAAGSRTPSRPTLPVAIARLAMPITSRPWFSVTPRPCRWRLPPVA